MENQFSASDNMSVSAISALSNVKEVQGEPKNYTHFAILLLMVIFVIFIVGLSVYNFQGSVVPEAKVIHAEANHSEDLQKLTNQ